MTTSHKIALIVIPFCVGLYFGHIANHETKAADHPKPVEILVPVEVVTNKVPAAIAESLERMATQVDELEAINRRLKEDAAKFEKEKQSVADLVAVIEAPELVEPVTGLNFKHQMMITAALEKLQPKTLDDLQNKGGRQRRQELARRMVDGMIGRDARLKMVEKLNAESLSFNHDQARYGALHPFRQRLFGYLGEPKR